MEGELPVTYNFYNEIKYGTLPSQYDNFLQSISEIYKFEPEKANSFFYELETNNHKFYKITTENYSELSKNKNATIYIYFTDLIYLSSIIILLILVKMKRQTLFLLNRTKVVTKRKRLLAELAM